MMLTQAPTLHVNHCCGPSHRSLQSVLPNEQMSGWNVGLVTDRCQLMRSAAAVDQMNGFQPRSIPYMALGVVIGVLAGVGSIRGKARRLSCARHCQGQDVQLWQPPKSKKIGWVQRQLLIFLGVLGIVPDSYWQNLHDHERADLAAEMAPRRTDGLAPLRYVFAMAGVLSVCTAVVEFAQVVPMSLSGLHEDAMPSLGRDAVLVTAGVGAMAASVYSVSWPAVAAAPQVQDYEENHLNRLVKSSEMARESQRQKHIEYLERVWKL